ncbi:hypothetical protein J3A83DRAFT_4064143, partial [Scleroderma citrinum]
VPSRSAPWLSAVNSCIYSLKQCFGIPRKDISPGEEKFMLLGSAACFFMGMRSVWFTMP